MTFLHHCNALSLLYMFALFPLKMFILCSSVFMFWPHYYFYGFLAFLPALFLSPLDFLILLWAYVLWAFKAYDFFLFSSCFEWATSQTNWFTLLSSWDTSTQITAHDPVLLFFMCVMMVLWAIFVFSFRVPWSPVKNRALGFCIFCVEWILLFLIFLTLVFSWGL